MKSQKKRIKRLIKSRQLTFPAHICGDKVMQLVDVQEEPCLFNVFTFSEFLDYYSDLEKELDG